MQLIKTVDNDNIIRIEEDGGSSISIGVTGNIGHILSVIVPKSDRREGIGSELLLVSEQLLLDRGIKTLEIDYSDEVEHMTVFLTDAGYTISQSAPIISVDMRAIFSSLTVQKAMANEVESAHFVTLDDMSVDQLDALLDSLSNFNINLGNSDIVRFMQETSGVVYDSSDTPQAFILSSEVEDGIFVDLLAAVGGSNPRLIVAAMQGMLNGIKNLGGSKNFEKLSMIACNSKVDTLLDKVLKKGSEPEVIGHAMYATKNLKKEPLNDIDIEDDDDDDMEDEWRREIKKIPMQGNINWKMPWHRLYGGDKPDSSSEGAGSSSAGREKKSGGTQAVANISFVKDEDETEGLVMDGTVRITLDNLGDFSGIIPPEVYYNMSRVFYRGLAVKNDGISAAIVWRYKNLEDDVIENEADIIWFSSSDTDSCDTLIKEFINEIATEDVVRSYFEFPDLSDDDKSIFEANGFDIEKRECMDIELTVADIAATPFASKKPAGYVKSIEGLSEKQFKRGVTNCLFYNRKGILDDVAFLPKDWFDNQISACVVADDKVVGLFLLHKNAIGKLYVDLLFSSGAEYQIDMLNMIRFGIHACADKYPGETIAVVRRHSDETRELVSKLFPNVKGKEIFYGERRDS